MGDPKKKQKNMSINQGQELLNFRQNVDAQNVGTQNLGTQNQNVGAYSGIEGFGMLGSFPGTLTGIDTKNTNDAIELTTNKDLFETKKTAYKTAYTDLKDKTYNFLNDVKTVNDNKRNYNIFINELVKPSDISSIRQGCYNYSTPVINNDYPMPVYLNPEPGFNTFYADKDITVGNAKQACELWAADGGKTLYGINANASGKFQCYTGNIVDLSSVTSSGIYTKTLTLMKLDMSILSPDANVENAVKGGLLLNGQIGIMGSSKNPLAAMTNGPPPISTCDIKYGGGINVESVLASYGRNCNNIETEIANVRYILVSHPTKYLLISQIVAYGLDTNNTIKNFAQGKPVSSDVNYPYYSSERAVVDGFVSGPRSIKVGQKNLYISQINGGGWLEIDLGTFGNQNKLFAIKFFGLEGEGVNYTSGVNIELLNADRLKISEINIKENGATQSFKLTAITNPTVKVEKPALNIPVIFQGPTSSNQEKISQVFKKPVTARYIRIYPLTWSYHISMRAGVLDKDNKTLNPPESSRSYSSMWDGGKYGHALSMLDSSQAWSAAANNTNQWMTIDLGNAQEVKGVVIQGRGLGRGYSNQFVKTFKVYYSMDNRSFRFVN
jgi:hypothetical protein